MREIVYQRGRLLAYVSLSGLIAFHMYVAVVNSSHPGHRAWLEIPAVLIDGVIATLLFVPIQLTPISLIIAGAGISFMVWAVVTEGRRHGRWRRSECPACGYPRGGGARCTECGRGLAAPKTSIKGWRYAVWFALAWLLGVLAAHVSLNLELRSFEREIARAQAISGDQAPDRIERRRWWPADSEFLVYVKGRGITATD